MKKVQQDSATNATAPGEDRRRSTRHEVDFYPLDIILSLPNGDRLTGKLRNECHDGIGVMLEAIDNLELGAKVDVYCPASPRMNRECGAATAEVVHLTRQGNGGLVGLCWTSPTS